MIAEPKGGCDAVKADCIAVIVEADKAINAKNKALQLSDIALKASQDNAASLSKDNDDLRETNAKWYHNPFVMLLLGGAATSVVYLGLKK